MLSLARAFAYAGSPNVVMSLWPVDDQLTSGLFTAFYEQLREQFFSGEALRAAKLHYIKEADEYSADPYYWAGFISIGNSAR